jgi:hypothetical protein
MIWHLIFIYCFAQEAHILIFHFFFSIIVALFVGQKAIWELCQENTYSNLIDIYWPKVKSLRFHQCLLTL